VIAGDDHGFDIRVNEIFGNDEFLSEDIQDPIVADQADQDDITLGDVIDPGHPGIGLHLHGSVIGGFQDLHRCFTPQAAIAVMAVVVSLKVLALPLEGLIVREPLSAKEHFIVGIIESLHGPIPPGFTNGDKHRCHSEMEAHPDDNPEGSGITVAAPKAQFVVELDKIRDAYGLPASEDTGCYRIIGLGPLRLEIDPVAEEIHHVE